MKEKILKKGKFKEKRKKEIGRRLPEGSEMSLNRRPM